MTEPKKYLYCIIACAEDRNFEDATPVGDAEGLVHTVTHHNLAAVVSDSPMAVYEATRANMMAHQDVLERVMQEFTMLPVRFGTVATPPPCSREQICKLLEKRHEEFSRLLGDLDGKVELGLKVHWRDKRAMFEDLLAENPDLRTFRDSLAGRPPAATHYDRIRLGELVEEALQRKRNGEATAMLAPLRKIARQTAENPLWADRMLVNAAFLVNKDMETAFDREISRIEEKVGPQFVLKYVGPIPPYNFVQVHVNWKEL